MSRAAHVMHAATRFPFWPLSGTSRGRLHPAGLLVILAMACACADPAKERLQESIRPTYDKATGKLTELTYDSDQNGRIDTWTEMDGNRPVRSRIDRNEDGRIDRWEYFDAQGRLEKVGFSRRDDGVPDGWAFAGPDGGVRRIELSSVRDERRIDRWEYYEHAAAGGTPQGLSRAEEDQDRDGRVDKWETYANGAIRTVAFDENADGLADRRFTYDGSALALIESQPDATGRFATRVRAR
jgi:hypothetical protein